MELASVSAKQFDAVWVEEIQWRSTDARGIFYISQNRAKHWLYPPGPRRWGQVRSLLWEEAATVYAESHAGQGEPIPWRRREAREPLAPQAGSSSREKVAERSCTPSTPTAQGAGWRGVTTDVYAQRDRRRRRRRCPYRIGGRGSGGERKDGRSGSRWWVCVTGARLRRLAEAGLCANGGPTGAPGAGRHLAAFSRRAGRRVVPEGGRGRLRTDWGERAQGRAEEAVAAAAGPANLELAPLGSFGGLWDALAGVLVAGHHMSAQRCCEEPRPCGQGHHVAAPRWAGGGRVRKRGEIARLSGMPRGRCALRRSGALRRCDRESDARWGALQSWYCRDKTASYPCSDCCQVMFQAPWEALEGQFLVLHLRGMACLPSIDPVPTLQAPAAT